MAPAGFGGAVKGKKAKKRVHTLCAYLIGLHPGCARSCSPCSHQYCQPWRAAGGPPRQGPRENGRQRAAMQVRASVRLHAVYCPPILAIVLSLLCEGARTDIRASQGPISKRDLMVLACEANATLRLPRGPDII